MYGVLHWHNCIVSCGIWSNHDIIDLISFPVKIASWCGRERRWLKIWSTNDWIGTSYAPRPAQTPSLDSAAVNMVEHPSLSSRQGNGWWRRMANPSVNTLRIFIRYKTDDAINGIIAETILSNDKTCGEMRMFQWRSWIWMYDCCTNWISKVNETNSWVRECDRQYGPKGKKRFDSSSVTYLARSCRRHRTIGR